MSEGLQSIKQQLREAQNAARDLGAEIARLSTSTNEVDVARVAQLETEFQSAVAASAQLRDSINDTNEQIAVLTAGSPFEQMSNSIGDVGSKIMSLDFEGAKESAQRLITISKQINFATAIQGVKDMGTAFLQLGKAILGNPFFLVVAAIVAIGVAIYKLMDELGLLKVIMDAVGKVFEWIMIPIDAMIQGLKDLTDWLGWTNNAATDLAEAQAEAATKAAEAQEESAAKITDALDHEIAMIKATGDDSDEAFEKILAAEKGKREQLLLSAKARAEEARAAYAAAVLKGDLDEKELADLEKKANEQTRIYNNTIKQNKVADVQADTDRKNRKDKQNKEDAATAKSNADSAAKAREDAKKKEDEYNAARLAAARRIEDLKLENMAEGEAKEIEMNRVKFERLRQDTLATTKLTLDEKKFLKEQYDIQELALEQKLANDKQAIIDAAKLKQKEDQATFDDELATIEEENYQKTLTAAQREEIAVRDKYFRLIETARQYGYDVAALEAQQATEIKAITDNAYIEELNANALRMSDKLFALEEEKRIALENTKLTLEEKQKLEEEYSEKRKSLVMDEISRGTAGAAQGLNAIQGLSNAIFDAKKSKLEKGSAEELKHAKKQFEINKKLQIAGALIQGVQAVLAAYSSGSAIPIVGAVTGPLFAALAAATVVANVMKIKNSKFEGGGSAPSAPSAGGGAAAISSATSAASTPALNFYGNANQGNNATAQQSVEANKQPTINVVATVSETEITSTQARMNKFKQNSEL